MKKLVYLVILLALSYVGYSADEKADEWKFSGDIQMRSELDGRDFSNITYPYSYTTLRTRFGVERGLLNNVSIFAQVQDSRIFGEEPGWTSYTKNLDLHQGYITLNNLFGEPISAKIGRWEMSYGSGRIIQSSKWSYIGGSFDGVVLGYKVDAFFVDLFGMTTTYSKTPVTLATNDTTLYPNPAKTDPGMNIWGFWGGLKLSKDQKLDLYTYYEFNGKKSNSVDVDLSRFTSGLNYELKIDNFTANVEFGYQFGNGNFANGKTVKYSNTVKATSDTTWKIVKDSTVTDKFTNFDIGAYMAFVGFKYNFNPLAVSLNADMLSGTAYTELTKKNTMYLDYQSKHTFYGYMDYLDNPDKSLKGRGLNDYFLRFDYSPKDNPFAAQLDAHYFMTNQPFQMSDKTENSNIGQEVDLVLKYKFFKAASLEWGGCLFLPGDIMKDMYVIKNGSTIINREDPGFWSYLMIRVFL